MTGGVPEGAPPVGLCCWWPHGCSGCRRARPPARSPHASFARSGRSRSPPVPSGPSGALHTSGAWVADGWLGVSTRCPARPRHRPRAPQPGQRGYRAPSNFACNSPVTISGFELASLELQRFWALLKVHAIELHAKFLVGVCVLTHGRCGPDQQSREHITRELRRSAPRNTMGPPPRRPRVVSGINQGKPP